MVFVSDQYKGVLYSVDMRMDSINVLANNTVVRKMALGKFVTLNIVIGQ